MWAALGIVLALETRRQTGVGQHVDVAMYECIASHVISNMNSYQATGTSPGRTRQAALNPGLALRASDGYVVMAGVRTPQRLAGLWELIGRPDLPQGDERYLQQFPDADFVFDEMIPAIEEWSSQCPKWEVAGRLTELGFSMGVAQSVADLADCPQLGSPVACTRTPATPWAEPSAPWPRRSSSRPAARRTPPRRQNWASTTPKSCAPWGGLSPEELSDLEEQEAV